MKIFYFIENNSNYKKNLVTYIKDAIFYCLLG